MRSYGLFLAFAASAAASPAGLFNRAAQVCNADNCLRAIRNTARPGLADCSSYLAATVTPATSTIYETLTETATPTQTIEVTHIVTNLATATVDVHQTITETTTNTRYVYVSAEAPSKRQVTVIPSAIPTYATACSGSVRYTSACACLGASPTTITVDAPTTVVTVYETVSPVTATEYVTVQTDEITVTDATVTNTIVATASTTVETTVPFTNFYIRVDGGPRHDGQYLQEGHWHDVAPDALLIRPGKPANGKALLTLDHDGALSVVGGTVFTYTYQVTTGTAFDVLNARTNEPYRPRCQVTSDLKFTCKHYDNPYSALVNCGGWSSTFAAIWNAVSLSNGGGDCYLLPLVVEPAV